MDWELFLKHITTFFSVWGVVAIKLAFLLAIGLLVIKIILKVTNKVMAKNKIEKTARKFFYNIIKFGLYLTLSIILLNVMGIPTTTFIIILVAVAVTLSVAFMNSLINLASGLVLIITKQVKEYEKIEIKNIKGVVDEVKLTHTIITAHDGNEIVVPNKMFLENVVYKNKNQQKKSFNNFKSKGQNKAESFLTENNKKHKNKNQKQNNNKNLEEKVNKLIAEKAVEKDFKNAEEVKELKEDNKTETVKNYEEENEHLELEKEYLDYTDEVEIIEDNNLGENKEDDNEQDENSFSSNEFSNNNLFNNQSDEVIKVYKPETKNEKTAQKPDIKKTKFGFIKPKKNKNKKTPIIIKK